MSTAPPDEDMTALLAWADTVTTELGLPPLDVAAVDQLLAMAGRAAHGVRRPAAPVTTFLAGLALGADQSLDLVEVDRRIAELLAK